MTTELASEMMTTEEAHAAAEEIRNLTQSFARDLGKLRALAIDFHGRKGWAALGYNTIEACAKNEFGWGRRQFYHQLTAGKIEESAGLPVGTTPERRIRPGVVKPQQDGNQVHNSLPASSDGRNNSDRAVEKIEQPTPEPVFECVEVSSRTFAEAPLKNVGMPAIRINPDSAQSEPEPEKITPSGVTGEDWARVEYASAPASGLGEIEAAVLKRNKISVGQAAGYFAQIVAAAEQGGPSWEIRLRIAARPNPK